MKKTFLWSLLAIMMVGMVGLSFTACDDDDDDNTSIVGTWTYREGRDYYISLTFNKNGRGTVTELEYDDVDTDSFEWETEGRNLYIYFIGDTDEEVVFRYRISGSTLTLTDEYGETLTLTRS